MIASGWRPPPIVRCSRSSAVGHVSPVDRVGQLPRRHAARLTEERLDVGRGQSRVRTEHADEPLDQSDQRACVLADVLGDARCAPARRPGGPPRPVAQRSRRSRPLPVGASAVDDLAAGCGDGSCQLGRNCAARPGAGSTSGGALPDQDQRGRGQRRFEVGEQRRSARRPWRTDRGAGPRRCGRR